MRMRKSNCVADNYGAPYSIGRCAMLAISNIIRGFYGDAQDWSNQLDTSPRYKEINIRVINRPRDFGVPAGMPTRGGGLSAEIRGIQRESTWWHCRPHPLFPEYPYRADWGYMGYAGPPAWLWSVARIPSDIDMDAPRPFKRGRGEFTTIRKRHQYAK